MIIIANLSGYSHEAMRKIADGFEWELVDFESAYWSLLFPVVSGTLFRARDINISVDLSNKSSGAKISYNVVTKLFDCDVIVSFAPTSEIARIMSNYRNSILKFNPRSYLEFHGQQVNSGIENTILCGDGNDFALLNNGITIVCDESGINEQSGRKNKAQLYLLNPQIINGGQTAYTLSRIYDRLSDIERISTFDGKEVLIKAIAIASRDGKDYPDERARLIERISRATNSQSTVTIADKTSGQDINQEIQETLFRDYGLLFERKRGEFSEGLKEGYIDQADVLDRIVFSRVYLVSNESVNQGLRRRILSEEIFNKVPLSKETLDRFYVGYHAFGELSGPSAALTKKNYVRILPKVFASVILSRRLEGTLAERGIRGANLAAKHWGGFVNYASKFQPRFVRLSADPESGAVVPYFRDSRTAYGQDFQKVAVDYFSELAV